MKGYLAKIKDYMNRFRMNKTVQKIVLFIEALICVWVVQDSALKDVEWRYDVELSVLKYFYTIFEKISGWGIENIFFFLGILCVFYFAKKDLVLGNGYLSVLSAFFAVCTVIGRSYYEKNDWSYITHGRLQFGLSVFVALGYYILFKHVIAFCCFCIKKGRLMEVRESRNRAERFLFETHPFGGPLLVIAAVSIPYVIAFFPGTLHWDALGQLWAYFGVIEWTGLHPMINSWLMGGCVEFGRNVFGSDNIGFFFYTFPQYAAQWLVFAYGIFLISKMKAPMVLRWGSLLYFTVFPTWKMWGYTMAKDTWYYIWLLLFVLLLIDIRLERFGKIVWWQWLLLALSPAGACLSKGNGLFVFLLALFAALLINRKYWKIAVLGMFTAAVPILLQNYVLMPSVYNGITGGPVSETMSIPMQQTARYLVVYSDELTEEERAVLEDVFMCPLEEVKKAYQPENSDKVKAQFLEHPTKEQLRAYYRVWFSQFRKHPSVYVQAFINHCYGFFYPNREMFNDTTARYHIGVDQEWRDGMDVYFGIKGRGFRDMIEKNAEIFNRLPVFGMLYSAGFHTYLLIGCIFYLCYYKKKKELVILLPAVCVVLFNLFSPINAYERYMLPAMAMLPFLIAWCYYITREDSTDKIRENI